MNLNIHQQYICALYRYEQATYFYVLYEILGTGCSINFIKLQLRFEKIKHVFI